MRQIVVMVTSSYPRFPGDGVGSFLEPIAKGVAACGHSVHIVAPWHPAILRAPVEEGVHFHFYRYAPIRSLNVFGYASGLHADTTVKVRAWLAAPPALAAGWLKARQVAAGTRATILHGHWVVPGGVTAALARDRRPLVISLHGSDVYVAERHRVARRAARMAFARAGWVTACSDDLGRRAVALGADATRTETLPYGVDAVRFRPAPEVQAVRRDLGLEQGPLVFAAGRLVRKKGFEYLIEAAGRLREDFPGLRLAIAGTGDLEAELRTLAARFPGTVNLLGNRSQEDIGRLSAAADVVAVPSVHDEAGNVDGLPNFALEATATATPVVATRVGGLPDLIVDGATGLLVRERDATALETAIRTLLQNPARARALGEAGRAKVIREFGWDRYAERLDAIYQRLTAAGDVRAGA